MSSWPNWNIKLCLMCRMTGHDRCVYPCANADAATEIEAREMNEGARFLAAWLRRNGRPR